MLGTEGGPHWAPYVTVSMEPVNACNFLKNKDIWKRTSPLCFSSNASPKTCITLPPSHLKCSTGIQYGRLLNGGRQGHPTSPPNDFPLGLIRSHMVVIHLFLMLCDLQRVVRDLCPTLYIAAAILSFCTLTLVIPAVCAQCQYGCVLRFLDFVLSRCIAQVFSKWLWNCSSSSCMSFAREKISLSSIRIKRGDCIEF